MVQDLSKALRINPNLADIYGNRGIARYKLGDRQRALTDLQRAADLFQQQGALLELVCQCSS